MKNHMRDYLRNLLELLALQHHSKVSVPELIVFAFHGESAHPQQRAR